MAKLWLFYVMPIFSAQRIVISTFHWDKFAKNMSKEIIWSDKELEELPCVNNVITTTYNHLFTVFVELPNRCAGIVVQKTSCCTSRGQLPMQLFCRISAQRFLLSLGSSKHCEKMIVGGGNYVINTWQLFQLFIWPNNFLAHVFCKFVSIKRWKLRFVALRKLALRKTTTTLPKLLVT